MPTRFKALSPIRRFHWPFTDEVLLEILNDLDGVGVKMVGNDEGFWIRSTRSSGSQRSLNENDFVYRDRPLSFITVAKAVQAMACAINGWKTLLPREISVRSAHVAFTPLMVDL